MKPILFNADMVRAILSGRKTVTRRVVKPQPPAAAHVERYRDTWRWSFDEASCGYQIKQTYRPGDILYVRETWQYGLNGTYLYKADAGHDLFMTPDGKLVSDIPWRQSIQMPKEAARLFLLVTNVSVAKLQDIKNDQAVEEGAVRKPNYTKRGDLVLHNRYRKEFSELWDSTVKKSDRALYGWDANPWVWVIEFERISKEEAEL